MIVLMSYHKTKSKSAMLTRGDIENPVLASFARAHTGTEEIAVRKEELTSKLLVAEQLEDGDQSPLQPAKPTKRVRNRRGRPRKDEARVMDKALSIEQVIQEAKAELRGYLVKTREIVLRVGQAFENAGTKPSKICRKIKKAFAEEISDALIHPRTIESYCPDKWKIETKPRKKGQKNAKRSFSESEATLPAERIEEAPSQTTPQRDTPVQKVFKITKEKFAAVIQAINRSQKECYLRFNQNNELDSIEADKPKVVEAIISE